MRGLSETELLHIWEVAWRQHPIERALTILATVWPETSRDKLLALSIGQRDTYLLTVRQATFGAQLVSYAECPACQEHLEFAFTVADILETERAYPSDTDVQLYEAQIDDYTIHFRPPNSEDLMPIVDCSDPAMAYHLLLQCCVVQALREGEDVPLATMPETVLPKIAEYIGECDPQAEVLFTLSCSACSHTWSIVFDIVTFLWSEICVQAKRLLREVHLLASAYGWSEAAILSMSTTRRQFYLEMVV
jgi:hypothetical protein